MTPIIAKLAARRDVAGVERMFAGIGQAAPSSFALRDVLVALAAVVDRLEHDGSPKSIASVRRYLAALEPLAS
jgi:hypothetical protein